MQETPVDVIRSLTDLEWPKKAEDGPTLEQLAQAVIDTNALYETSIRSLPHSTVEAVINHRRVHEAKCRAEVALVNAIRNEP